MSGQDAIDTALAIAHRAQTTAMHTGAIHSAVGGRTDHIPMTVPSNSYVLPADVVSAMPGAEGNTQAGHRILDEMLKKAPYNSTKGAAPYGSGDNGPYGAEKRASGGRVEPSEAQKEAGNYKKRHMIWRGLSIAIENDKGSIRSGVAKDGRRWAVRMPADYGYIKRTVGADGDHVDCYVGPDKTSDFVLVIDQRDPGTKRFDEHKVMLGFPNEKSAVSAYEAGFSDGKGLDRLGSKRAMNVDGLKAWLRDGDTTKRVVSSGPIDRAAIDHALQIARAMGGPLPDRSDKGIPIVAAGGEYVIAPHQVQAIGGGDVKAGHKVLDALVKNIRDANIKTLKSLPGPVKDPKK